MSLTRFREARGTLATAGAVSADEQRDAAEAAGLGHGWLQVAVGAVRVGAAPRPRLRRTGLGLRAALETGPVSRASMFQPESQTIQQSGRETGRLIKPGRERSVGSGDVIPAR